MEYKVAVNEETLVQNKENWMRVWQLTEEQWDVLIELITKKTWRSYHQRGVHDSFGKRDYMEAISEAILGYGAECLYPEYPHVYYVNMGDTYNTTFVLIHDELFVSCWGDVFEALESENLQKME